MLRRKLRRKEMVAFFQRLEPTVVGIEACGGAHHWARVLQQFGHQVKLLPPKYAKAYVKRGKNDAADAEALCEAMSRPTMRFVAAKTPEQQAAQMLVGTRDRLIRRRTQLTNATSRLCRAVWTDRGAGRRQDRAVAGTPAIPNPRQSAVPNGVPLPLPCSELGSRKPSRPAVTGDRIQQAGHMAASGSDQNAAPHLASRGPSTYGHRPLFAGRGRLRRCGDQAASGHAAR